jgi:hypothetical protein
VALDNQQPGLNSTEAAGQCDRRAAGQELSRALGLRPFLQLGLEANGAGVAASFPAEGGIGEVPLSLLPLDIAGHPARLTPFRAFEVLAEAGDTQLDPERLRAPAPDFHRPYAVLGSGVGVALDADIDAGSLGGFPVMSEHSLCPLDGWRINGSLRRTALDAPLTSPASYTVADQRLASASVPLV